MAERTINPKRLKGFSHDKRFSLHALINLFVSASLPTFINSNKKNGVVNNTSTSCLNRFVALHKKKY